MEAFREYHIKNILAMIAANQGLIKQYLDGKLRKDDEVPQPVAGPAGADGEPELAREQQTVVDEILESLKAGKDFLAAVVQLSLFVEFQNHNDHAAHAIGPHVVKTFFPPAWFLRDVQHIYRTPRFSELTLRAFEATKLWKKLPVRAMPTKISHVAHLCCKTPLL